MRATRGLKRQVGEDAAIFILYYSYCIVHSVLFISYFRIVVDPLERVKARR